MVATQAGGDVLSIGSRRTRRQQRSRKRRAHLRKSITTAPRKSVFMVLGMAVTVIEAVGKGVRWGLLWGLIVLIALLVFCAQKGRLLLAGAGRDTLTGVMYVAEKGFRRHALLFVGLLGCGLAALTHGVAGQTSVALLFCLLGVLMCVGLWIGERREGGEE